MRNLYTVNLIGFKKVFIQSSIVLTLFTFTNTAIAGGTPANKFSKASCFTDPSIRISLYSKANNLPDLYSDEVQLNFDNNYNNAVDNNDIAKINYSTDNLAIQKSSYQLSTEKRKPLTNIDTVFLSLSNTKIGSYYFIIEPQLVSNANLQAFIKDKYLLTETLVSFENTTNINFSINADAASKASDRFYIFLRPSIPAGPLSVTFLSLSAITNANKTNLINWKVAIEVNLEKYQTEKSTTPYSFKQFGTDILPIGGGNAASYFQIDNDPAKGINYYRIKAISTNGQITYSNIVKLDIIDKTNAVNVFPNPTTPQNINIRFNDMAGKYGYTIFNNSGQLVQKGSMQIAKAVVEKRIEMKTILPVGTYFIIMENEYGKTFSSKLNIQ